METIKRYWKAIASALGAIIGFIFLRQYFQKDLLAKLLNGAASAKDAVLNERKNQVSNAANEEKLRNDELRKELGKDAPKADPNEIEDFYNKKLK
jgi:hypothetical protein